MPIRIAHEQDGVRVQPAGELTVAQARELYVTVHKLARSSARRVLIDLSRVDEIDSAGVVAVSLAERAVADRGKQAVLVGVGTLHREAFKLLEPRQVAPELPRRPGVLEQIGGAVLEGSRDVREFGGFIAATVRGIVKSITSHARLRGSAFIEQAVIIGANAVPIVVFLGALVGVILAFQGIHQLRDFGAPELMAEVVSLGMVREFGSFVVAIILAGRSGAAMSAELGTMKVNEEIDALEGMGIDPASFLVAPRVAAITLVTPLLTLLATAAGIIGGLAIARFEDLPVRSMIYRMQEALELYDFVQGFLKSVVFAWVIGLCSCFVGLRTRGGAHGVGQGATRAVVVNIVLIVVFDSAITTVWTVLYD